MVTKKSRPASRTEPPADAIPGPKRASGRAPIAAMRKKRTPPAPPRANGATEEEIRVRAYYLSVERDGRGSDPLADWLRAERELAGGKSKA